MTTTRQQLPVPPQTFFWLGVFAFLTICVWLLGSVLAPFLTGMAIAYLLDPAVSWLSRRMPRSLASLIVLVGFALLVTSVIVVLSPMIAKQFSGFMENLPHYIERASQITNDTIDKAMGRLSPADAEKVREAAGSQVGALLTASRTVLERLWSGGLALIDIVTFMVITPVVAFYCLRDWPQITEKFNALLPRKHAKKLRQMMSEFNMRLAGFVRGQLLVCLSLGAMYAVMLTVVGLNFGLAIGLMAGVLSFIPYVGTFVGFVSSVGVALVQYDDLQMPIVVVGLFFLGQFIEGNFLTPKLVGERIGLHAVWVIFALMAGGKLFGFTGMLLAVPVAALIGVIVRHAIIWYKKSPAYLGHARK